MLFMKYVDKKDILDTTDATATENDILKGKSAYVKGKKVEGTLEIVESVAIEGTMSSSSDLKKLIKEIDGNVVINATDGKEFFYNYTNLVTIKSLDTSKLTKLSYMFSNCTSLVDVCVMDWSNVINSGTAETNLLGVFNKCSNLSDESLNNIMASCISAVNYSGTNTLSLLGIYNVQERCKNLSNYQAFIDAGWGF